MNIKRFYFLCFFLFLFFHQIIFAKELVPSPFENIKKTYSAINTIEAVFTQRIFISNLKKEREFEGNFFYKKGRGFLWRYNKPKIRYFLYDGNFIWQADEDKPFVYKRRFNREKTVGTFFDLMDDISKMDELFKLKEKNISGDMEIIELIPKKEGQIISAKLWVDRINMIKKIEIIEFTGNVNTINFNYTRINEPISDAKFIYKQEKGKEIIESN
ncbi:MAG: outer membrane lipoprotein carrier protein LolA [Syntrophorhabdaceae bacterium]|nr:outer membrane lipoprotein carrier protein LolA [Syntrophorhabdaceae bacterium]